MSRYSVCVREREIITITIIFIVNTKRYKIKENNKKSVRISQCEASEKILLLKISLNLKCHKNKSKKNVLLN